MAREGNSVNKTLFRSILIFLRVIPMVLALVELINTTLGLLGISGYILTRIGGISLIPFIFVYLSSWVFGFCLYHRLFLYYILVNHIITNYDYFIGIPLDDFWMAGVYSLVAGTFSFLILYCYRKHRLCFRQ